MMQQKSETIALYYDTCECDYRTFWNLDKSLALHAGYWDKETKSLAEALENENAFLAEVAQIQEGDRVLDAGCGVGGSSIYLAAHYGCHVTGITLSEKQVMSARSHARQRGVEEKTTFEMMDFCRTAFPDGSFDVVWGIESICHAEDKQAFIREAYMLLKPGGRLVIADGFASTFETPHQEMKRWLNGWGVETLDTVSAFQSYLVAAGFESMMFRTITENVLPSSKRLYWISLPAYVYSKVGEWLGKRTRIQTDNISAAYYQYRTLKKGFWEYGVFYAKK